MLNFSKKFKGMGTDISVDIITDQESKDKAIKSIEKAENIFLGYEKKFSRFNKKSELFSLNCHLNQSMNISPEMQEILQACLKYYHDSDGYFDPRIIENLENIGYTSDFHSSNFNSDQEIKKMHHALERNLNDDLIVNSSDASVLLHKRIDVSGLAKGYAVDKVKKYLLNCGWDNFIIDAGGDMYAQGYGTSGFGWLIDIENISENLITLKLINESIATSGRTRRYWQKGNKKFHHLVNPKKPDDFSFALQTVTVIADSTIKADAWAKILFLMGLDRGLKYANMNDIKVLFLDNQNDFYPSKKLTDNLYV